MLSGSCLLHAACRWLQVPRRMLRVVCHIFPDAGCMLSIVCCTISSGRLRHAVRLIMSTCPFFVACRTFSVAVVCACCPSQRPMSHGVRCLSPGPASHLICCMCCVASRLLHVAYRPLRVAYCLLSRRACCMSHAACCPLQSGAAPSHKQRIAAVLAIERLGGRRGSLQCRPRCACVRACVHACVWVASGTVSLWVPVRA
jgi:hypothetical protein